MFCHKCGAKSIDGAEFCQKCGAKLIKNEAAESSAEDIRYDTVPSKGAVPVAAVSASGNSINVNTNGKPVKKKSKKRFFIIGAVILIIIIIIAASTGNSEMDYIETVKAYAPFANSQGLPYTCDEVFGKYIKSAVWETSSDGDTRNVTVSGTIKGTDIDIAVTIKASPDPNDSERALMSPVSVRIGNDTTTVKGDAGDIIYVFFSAYDEGLEDLAEFKGEMSDLHILLESIAEAKAGDITLSQTFNGSGISFKYPNGWEVRDMGSEFVLAEIIYSENHSGDIIRVNIHVRDTIDTDPFYVFSGDEQTVREAVNENMVLNNEMFMEYGDTSIGGVPAKFLKYQKDGLTSPETVLNYFYRTNETCYCVSCTYTSSEESTYKPIFEQIINSYTIIDNSAATQNTNASDDEAAVRNAYIQKVQELAAENSDFKFALADITANNVYELVADMPGYYVNIYSYDNGNVIPIMEEWGYGAGGNQGYQYLPGKNIILNTTLTGAGRESYETYMCVDSNNKVVNVYDYDLCFSYPSSYYYGSTEIDEYTYSSYKIQGDYSPITGNLSADDMISAINGGIDIRSSVSGEILFNGRTAESLLGVPINSIIKQWGEPLDSYFGDEYNHYCNYDGIYFGLYDYSDMIGSISLSPEKCSIDGNTLNKSRDELVKIISKPAAEEWRVEYSYDVQNDAYYEKDIYCIDYEDYTASYSLSIIMYSPNEHPNEINIMSK